MNRQRLLSIALVIMVLLNAATLAVLLLRGNGHPPHPPRGGPKAIIIERLHFDREQVERYEALIAEHREHIRASDERMMDLRRRLYVADAAEREELINAIGQEQSAVERVHTAHFDDIRALCHPDQVPLFDALRRDLADYFRPGPPPPDRER